MKKLGSLLFASLCLFSLASCDKKSKLIDYVSQVSLPAGWENKSFLATGTGQVTLDRCVDGDTAHFYAGSTYVKVRFNGIDTPESTGAIEPWGKKASKFTCNLLTKAKENNKPIVLTSDNDFASTDSNGRYLAWVWADGVLVNLAVVQEGLAVTKGASGTIYDEVFYKANEQARANKLNIWSGKKDPDYNYGAFQVMNLKEINTKYVEDPESIIGAKVSFNAVISRVSGQNAYVQQDVINDDGSLSTYGLYVFSGYNPFTELIFQEGNNVNFKGVLALFNGNLQLTDMKYSPNGTGDAYSQLLEKDNDYTLQTMTIPQIKATPYTNVLVKLENVSYVKSGSYRNDKGMSINVKDDQNNQIIIRVGSDLYFTDEEGNEVTDVDYFADKGKMTFIGNITYYAPEEGNGTGSNQITLSKMEDVIYRKATAEVG